MNPKLIGMDSEGIAQLAHKSIMKCDIDIRNNLYANMVLCGGNTMFNGIDQRFLKDMISLAPKNTKVNVTAIPERKYGAWLGGSILSALSSFHNMWITKEQFEEEGPKIVHQKCF